MEQIKLSRDERQDIGIAKWKEAGGRGTCVYPTGYGKTRVALKFISRLRKVKEDASIIVVVPTDYLQGQWQAELAKWEIEDVQVLIINTAIKGKRSCDLLIVDRQFVHFKAI